MPGQSEEASSSQPNSDTVPFTETLGTDSSQTQTDLIPALPA